LTWPAAGADDIIEFSGADPEDSGDDTLTANEVDCVVISDCEEFGEPNHDIDDGYVIDSFPLIHASAELCDSSDDDGYTVETTAGCTITVELEFTHTGTSDIDFTVLNADGSVAVSTGSGSSNTFASDLAGSDRLNLHAFGLHSTDIGPYLLSITEDRPVMEDCVEDPFEDTLDFCSGG
jgi:hypothetical protein